MRKKKSRPEIAFGIAGLFTMALLALTIFLSVEGYREGAAGRDGKGVDMKPSAPEEKRPTVH